jgi:hypothetical protein
VSDLLRVLLPALEAAARRTLRSADLDAVIVHNTGAIPPVRGDAGAHSGAPGFNVVIGERGRPIYFCKCRPAGDPALAHEGAIGDILRRDRVTAAHIAAPHLQQGEVMDVLVLPRLSGRPYHELLVDQSEAEWLSSVEDMMRLVEQMSARVGAALPALRGPAASRFSDEARWALAALATGHGLAQRRSEALATALVAGGTTTALLQHGDLWPPNVLADRGKWYVLDLELFGRVRVPLYDLLHMLHICSDVRRPANADARSWIERIAIGDAAEAGPLGLIRRTAARQGLSPAATFAALVYYVVDIAARVKARGAWTADWREYVDQVERLADLIADGAATPDRLFKSARG